MTISSSAGAAISIKKFLSRHRRRRQATSPFIAKGDPSFLRIRSCGTLLLSKEVHANDPAARDSSSLSKLPVIPDAEVFYPVSPLYRIMPSNSIPLPICLSVSEDFYHRSVPFALSCAYAYSRASYTTCNLEKLPSALFCRQNFPRPNFLPVRLVSGKVVNIA